MNTHQEPLSGFIPTRSLISTKEIHLRGLKGSGKDKEPWKEKSKDKKRKKDWSKDRERKRQYD